MARKARAVGINHVALEVGDIEEALAFYSQFLEFELRGKSETMAFIDLGDQFLALSAGRERRADEHPHFGFVVDDKDAVRATLEELNIEIVSERFLDFFDPWGNRIEIIGYDNIQFSKLPSVLKGMGMDSLQKNESALQELREKGMAPD